MITSWVCYRRFNPKCLAFCRSISRYPYFTSNNGDGLLYYLLPVLQDFVCCYWMIKSVKKYYNVLRKAVMQCNAVMCCNTILLLLHYYFITLHFTLCKYTPLPTTHTPFPKTYLPPFYAHTLWGGLKLMLCALSRNLETTIPFQDRTVCKGITKAPPDTHTFNVFELDQTIYLQRI